MRGSAIKIFIKLQRYNRSSLVNITSQSQTATGQARFRALREMSMKHDKHVLSSFFSTLLKKWFDVNVGKLAVIPHTSAV